MRHKERILVVEDEKSITNFISTVLAANNFDVLSAQNGSQALMLASSHCPDAIILDLGLPDIDGQRVIQSIREWSEVPSSWFPRACMSATRWQRWIWARTTM